MDFRGTGKRLAQGDIGDAAKTLGVETEVLLAFLEVEAAGRGFDSQNRPKMLFEPHVFYRNTSGAIRAAAEKAGLAYAKWKAGAYPKDSYPRLQQALLLALEPAYRSASYGLPQILGENHKAAGFASAAAMFAVFKQGEREQLLAMVTLMQDWGMRAMLTGKDFTKAASWEPAARKYNGAGYATHGYHTKLAAAYRKHKDGEPMSTPNKTTKPAVAVLERGMRGEAVLALQKDLAALGYQIVADGRFGANTDTVVKQFQAAYRLVVDGKVGPGTRKALDAVLDAQPTHVEPASPMWPGQEPATPAPAVTGSIAEKLLWLAATGVALAIMYFVFIRR